MTSEAEITLAKPDGRPRSMDSASKSLLGIEILELEKQHRRLQQPNHKPQKTP